MGEKGGSKGSRNSMYIDIILGCGTEFEVASGGVNGLGAGSWVMQSSVAVKGRGVRKNITVTNWVSGNV